MTQGIVEPFQRVPKKIILQPRITIHKVNTIKRRKRLARKLVEVIKHKLSRYRPTIKQKKIIKEMPTKYKLRKRKPLILEASNKLQHLTKQQQRILKDTLNIKQKYNNKQK